MLRDRPLRLDVATDAMRDATQGVRVTIAVRGRVEDAAAVAAPRRGPIRVARPQPVAAGELVKLESLADRRMMKGLSTKISTIFRSVPILMAKRTASVEMASIGVSQLGQILSRRWSTRTWKTASAETIVVVPHAADHGGGARHSLGGRIDSVLGF